MSSLHHGRTWGIVPAAGQGSRMQPLAFSKELLPVGSRVEGDRERPRAVSEYLVERLVLGGATRICFVISPGKSDILEYYGGSVFSADLFYAVQPRAAGLCDAIFRAAPLVAPDDWVLVGLPDTIWYRRTRSPRSARTRSPFSSFQSSSRSSSTPSSRTNTAGLCASM